MTKYQAFTEASRRWRSRGDFGSSAQVRLTKEAEQVLRQTLTGAVVKYKDRVPYSAPPDALPLREVIAQIATHTRQLNAIDDDIGRELRTLEDVIRQRRPAGRPVDVPFPPWGKLGWSGRRGRWRLVVVDDEKCEDLLAMPRACRAEAFLVLGKLVERLGL